MGKRKTSVKLTGLVVEYSGDEEGARQVLRGLTSMLEGLVSMAGEPDAEPGDDEGEPEEGN